MRSVSGSSWGASGASLLLIYRALIRSVIDYGAIAYDSACKSLKHQLDVLHIEITWCYFPASMSLIIMRNRNGLITLPCGVPFSSLHDLESDDPILTFMLQSFRKSETKFNMLSFNPIIFILCTNPLCHTKLKAFPRSIITASVYCLLCIALCASSASLNI